MTILHQNTIGVWKWKGWEEALQLKHISEAHIEFISIFWLFVLFFL